eukprot:9279413-Alexandrium_andersonii.AAC.1
MAAASWAMVGTATRHWLGGSPVAGWYSLGRVRAKWESWSSTCPEWTPAKWRAHLAAACAGVRA